MAGLLGGAILHVAAALPKYRRPCPYYRHQGACNGKPLESKYRTKEDWGQTRVRNHKKPLNRNLGPSKFEAWILRG